MSTTYGGRVIRGAMITEEQKQEIMKRVEIIKQNIDDVFVLIEASKLSLNDEFMQYEPDSENTRQREFKDLLVKVIEEGVKDFYKPKYDPSFTEDGNGICFVAGKMPAVGKTYDWYEKAAKEYNPALNTRIGTWKEYVAFLGVRIKRLLLEGWEVSDAWYAVCNDSKKLGHYRDSENAKHEFEYTGSREICGFYDLANTYKILAWDNEAGGVWWAGGCYKDCSCYCPLADLCLVDERDNFNRFGVVWLVHS